MSKGFNPMQSEMAMHQSERCGANTRDGTSCEAPAVGGEGRCRMHGGAEGSGAPEGSQNALKHGLYTKEMKELNDFLADVLSEIKG